MSPETPFDDIDLHLPFTELLSALRDGDERAWTQLYSRLLDRATRAVCFQIANKVPRLEKAAQEVAESAVLSAYRTIFRRMVEGKEFELRSWSDLTALFIRIALNKGWDKVKERQREVNLTDLSPTSATEDGALTVDFPGQDPSPLEHMIRQEAGLEFKRIVDLVRRRLHRRDPTEREIFNLALEGKSNQEVIEELGCSLTAVKRCRRFVADLIRRMVTEENPGGSTP